MDRIISCKCPLCGEITFIGVNSENYDKWANGSLNIQDALPELSVNEREVLITNMCPKCIEEVYASFEDGDMIEDDEDNDLEKGKE